jgi:mRNA interferase MazF
MTSFRKGEVVLVKVEFTDRTRSKLRPAVVLSTLGYNRMGYDVVIAPITSNLAIVPHLGDHRIVAWEPAGLLVPGIVQAKPATLDETFVRRKIGALLPSDLEGVEAGLRRMFDLP